jgi:hypothetical protein
MYSSYYVSLCAVPSLPVPAELPRLTAAQLVPLHRHAQPPQFVASSNVIVVNITPGVVCMNREFLKHCFVACTTRDAL